MQIIDKYFPHLTDLQRRQFEQLNALYREWNAKINVISRKDIDNLYPHHVLHSLAIAMAIRFKDGTNILDLGTGGGFPGIPLAIMFPKCKFKLIDGTGKKIQVVKAVCNALDLRNVKAEQLRAEEEREKFDFIVTRAVMPLPDLMRIIKNKVQRTSHNALPNGLLCLKGGNLEEELKGFRKIADVMPITGWFDEEWFKDKNIIYLPC